VIDLGLRLEDIGKLQSEDVFIEQDAAANLRKNGATEEEIAWLLKGKRVELNAFASDELIAFIERKLAEHGIRQGDSRSAYARGCLPSDAPEAVVQAAVDDAVADLDDDEMPVPEGLAERISEMLANEKLGRSPPHHSRGRRRISLANRCAVGIWWAILDLCCPRCAAKP
jgi:hypothetical protein